MRKIILGAILLILSTSTFSQQTNSSPILTNPDHGKKSKNQEKEALIRLGENQKKVAFTMLGGGAIVVLAGILIPKGEIIHSAFLGDTYENDGIKDGFVWTGMFSVLGSIPLFIVSSKNKKKAAALSLKNEKIQTLQKGSFAYKFVPSVSVTIRL